MKWWELTLLAVGAAAVCYMLLATWIGIRAISRKRDSLYSSKYEEHLEMKRRIEAKRKEKK